MVPLRNGLAGRGIYIPLFLDAHFGSGGTLRPAAKMTAHKTVSRSLWPTLDISSVGKEGERHAEGRKVETNEKWC